MDGGDAGVGSINEEFDLRDALPRGGDTALFSAESQGLDAAFSLRCIGEELRNGGDPPRECASGRRERHLVRGEGCGAARGAHAPIVAERWA